MGKAKVKWGILSTAKIGLEKVIPSMKNGHNVEIVGIASRDISRARQAAEKLDIPKYFGTYEDLINDPEIEVIYNPLPNHLHYEWTKKAMLKGKHVLCEKPMTLKSEEIEDLIKLRDKQNLKVGEAFMVHTHPQWIDVVEKVKSNELGKLRIIQGFFSYYKKDPENIRNIFEYGGGAMWDIGCYPVHISRYVFNEEPKRVLSLVDRDPIMKIDRLVTVILDFPSGQATFSASTQVVPNQTMVFFGEKKKLEVDIPFNAPNDRKCKIIIDEGDLYGADRSEVFYDICDQYTIQGELFSEAILSNSEVPVSLEDSLGNIKVIESIFMSERVNNWVEI